MQLTLIETEEAYLVVFDNNPDDWVAHFRKSNHFSAQEWAARMAKLYNLRELGLSPEDQVSFEVQNLRESADLYAEIYDDDVELQELTEAAISGSPKLLFQI